MKGNENLFEKEIFIREAFNFIISINIIDN